MVSNDWIRPFLTPSLPLPCQPITPCLLRHHMYTTVESYGFFSFPDMEKLCTCMWYMKPWLLDCSLLQGPLQHTLAHFWQMVWEQRTAGIIMLNKCMERGMVCRVWFAKGGYMKEGMSHDLILVWVCPYNYLHRISVLSTGLHWGKIRCCLMISISWSPPSVMKRSPTAWPTLPCKTLR